VTDPVAPAVARIRAWGEERDWRGYDPYDALNSPAAPVLTLGTRLGRRVLTQVVKRSPVNLRPLLRIGPDWNAKAIGLVASGYARLAAAGDAAARAAAERWLDWLAANHSGDEAGLAWGYHFDVQTRFFRYAKGTPNTIATSFVAQAFLDGASLLGDERRRDAAASVAEFLESRMLAEGPLGPYFRYLPGEDELVHNANLLACAVCARAGRPEPARRALVTSLRAQREDGSWPYSEGPQGRWVDNFHTGYVLESLAACKDLDADVPERLARGLDYWSRTMFLPDGTPKYTPDSLYPVDAHCYATAIDTWLAAGDLAQAQRLATQLVNRMLDRAGYVHFQQNRYWTNRVPFVRWTTAPTFKALAGVLMGRARLD
jgi:polysaccharide biosynthesis protein VpsJ